MKYLLTIALVLISLSVFAEDIPTYLKDGVITVTLKDGKQYSFSANEYKVVKRGSKAKVEITNTKVEQSKEKAPAQPTPPQEMSKNIVSFEVLKSSNGLTTSKNSNKVEVEETKKLGVGIQYQRNVYEDLFIGGRVDSNGGVGLSLGLGF